MEDYTSNLEILKSQWNEGIKYLENSNLKYNEISKLKKIELFDRMFQVIDNCKELLITDTKNITYIYRAASGKWDSIDRFIPKWEYASENRMNGSDKLYYYFGITYKKYSHDAIKCCLKEIRLKEDEATICNFNLKDNLKIIDLTRLISPPRSDIDIEPFFRECIKKIGDTKLGIEFALSKIYFSMFSSSGAFTPIDKDAYSENEIIKLYKPFWTLTEYLESLNFDGLIFNSSVYEDGKCLVIFNLNNAEAISSSISYVNKSNYF